MNNAQLINNIKAECKKQNIALGIMLEHCHLSKGFIYDVEKRDRTPAVDKVSAIADYLGVSTDYLLGRTTEKNLSTNYGIQNHSDNNQGDNGLQGKMLGEFDKLDFKDQVKVLNLIAELSEKKGA